MRIKQSLPPSSKTKRRSKQPTNQKQQKRRRLSRNDRPTMTQPTTMNVMTIDGSMLEERYATTDFNSTIDKKVKEDTADFGEKIKTI